MSKFEVKCTRPGCGQGVETPDIDEVMAWSAAHDEPCPALKTGGSGMSAERYDEPMYELSEGGSTLRAYPHISATLDDLLTIEINGPADSVRLSWSDALELSDALRDLIGQGTFKEDALRAAEKRGAEELQRRIDVVLAWHNPVESEYRDADGNVTRTVTECAHCSTLADDGIDWPCATASALGAASGEVTR
jgi:hypothetical protein